MTAVYIGDSVYADFDGYQVILYTDNGCGTENEIFLDMIVYNSLTRYVDNVTKENKDKDGII